MYVLGLFVFIFFATLIKIGSMYYDALRKPLFYLKKERYNMKTVYELRRLHPSWVREDERHLYQKR